MSSKIVRRTSLALASVTVAVTAVLTTGGLAAATPAAGSGSGSGDSSASASSQSASQRQKWDEICREVNRNDRSDALREAVPQQSGDRPPSASEEARLRWVWDQITWLCAHR